MTCNKCKSENIRTFNRAYLQKKIRFLPIWKKTDIQLLYVCGDCGTMKVLVHEFQNEFERMHRHTRHYGGVHVAPANGFEICNHRGGFADYISTVELYFFKKTANKIDFNVIKPDNTVIVSFSDWFFGRESPPLYDPTGDYSVVLEGKRYPVVIPHGPWGADQWK